MLDSDTKRRIDTARDILVGKVPDPKSQVEQITIALIYKFMDDMDAEAEELGGKRKFFSADFARYGWSRLMHAGLSGYETLNLYAEGITRMPENPGMPALFRDIFKNAYLPYRDPETLRAFLKVIDEFSYDHSERLGDAFEYLLSVLGSQGDAGQFRTPRHIIDFIVDVIDPHKHETVLDPACGTAGFLISSYKHILRTNRSADGHSTLTPDERGRLAQNFKGYDISPDMVRLSLVNLYLHGFVDPHIVEYDTLTSQERWNEFADVILANPPFMSPKGGIKPHNRFSVQSKRSEVLFVDYMAEHLTPNGRAGIIVPEGVIFQSQTAYKELRKMLVANSLVAVVSLPAGVFNPYSGVKTSILILNRALAKKAEAVAFFKVENDGFGLGAQRRPIEKNDLPQVSAELNAYLRALRNQEPVADLKLTRGLLVPRAKIAANGDYNLSGERYGVQSRVTQTQWPVVPLGELCSFLTGGTPTSTVAEYYENGTIPWLVSGDIHKREIWDCEKRITKAGMENSNARELPPNSVLIALNGQGKTRGTVALLRMKGATCNQSLVVITPSEDGKLLPEFLFHVLRSMYSEIRALTGDTERSGLNIPILKGISIPLPPLDVQQEIVAEIKGYQKVIDGARAVLDHYRPHIPIDPAWPLVKLGEYFVTMSGGTPSKAEPDFWVGQIPWVSPKDVKSDIIEDTEDHISEAAINASTTKLIPSGSVVCVVRSGILKHSLPVALLARDMCINQDLIAFKPLSDAISSRFLFYVLKTRASSILEDAIKPGVTVQSVHNGFFRDYPIPLPPLATQQALVAEIEAEQALVHTNRDLIARFERKIQAALARVWGAGSRSNL
jgi:type I restriction enzyme M protein